MFRLKKKIDLKREREVFAGRQLEYDDIQDVVKKHITLFDDTSFSITKLYIADSSYKHFAANGVYRLKDEIGCFVRSDRGRYIGILHNLDHWTTFMITRHKNNKLNCIYIDSLGRDVPNEFRRQMARYNIDFTYNKTRVQFDNVGCGLFATSNALFMNTIDTEYVERFMKVFSGKKFKATDLRNVKNKNMLEYLKEIIDYLKKFFGGKSNEILSRELV